MKQYISDIMVQMISHQVSIFYVIRPYVLHFVKCVPPDTLETYFVTTKNIDVLMAS